MFVRLRMTANPFTVSPDSSIREAIAIMDERRIRGLPVVKDGAVVGVLSRGDIDKASPSKATSLAAGEVNYLLAKLKVSQAMTRHPITITSDSLLEEAALLMRDNKIEMLPVVDDGHLVGIITESAILDAFIELMGFRDSGTRLTIELDDSPGVLERVAGIMADHGANIKHLAVYRGQTDRATLVVGLNSLNTEDIEADLEKAGYRVIYRLENR
ncbi:MAG: CBS domain-containing protein [Actinomycetales bacterium]|jgi:Predicted transcriptional regulator, contains C-terminal CBS domains|nr:CBS domain-containing protein [Actinomycetales bacterium]